MDCHEILYRRISAVGLDQILKMGCSKEKEDSEIRLDPVLVLIWIKPSVCAVQNVFVGLGPLIQKIMIILIPAEGRTQGGFQEQSVINLVK